MPRYRLTIAYDGTDFHGWQRQLQPEATAREHGHTAPVNEEGRVELRTVQSVLTKAIKSVIRQPVHVQGASRTDSGVHARAQTAAFDTTPGSIGPPVERLARAINSKLPDDVIVRAAMAVPDDFDPTSDCIVKGYRYSFFSSHNRPLWDRRFFQHVHEGLDVTAMHNAAAHLVGTHDFAAFAAAGHGRDSTVRTIIQCNVTEHPASEEDPGAKLVLIDVAADGFLWNMVRIIAGTLFDVGRGRFTPDDIAAAISSLDRRAAGPTMPPRGLCLQWAHYPADDLETRARACNIEARILEELQESARTRRISFQSQQENTPES